MHKILILALALLLAPFFSKNSVAADTVSPEVVNSELGTCGVSPVVPLVTEDACRGLFTSYYQSIYAADASLSFTVTYQDATSIVWKILINWTDVNGDLRGITQVNQNFGGITQSTDSVCPNPEYPNHIYSISDASGDVTACSTNNPALEQCEQGNFQFAIGGNCIPIDCGDSGTQSTMWASGSVYNNTSGTWCDGSCAHSVSGGQNNDSYNGNIGLSGVSTGEICGQGGLEDRWHNEGNGDNCVSENGFINCPNSSEEGDNLNPETIVDLTDEQFFLEEIIPLIPVEEVCAVGDTSCEVRNLKETIVSRGLEQNEIDKVLHNKRIAADEITTKKIVDGIENSIGRNLQGLEMLTTSVDGLSGSLGAGGSSNNGDGFGDGDVTCDGDDCEGGILTDIQPTAGLVGYWETDYENGLQGVMDEQLIDIKNTEFFTFLQQFNPSIGGGSAPSYQMCFNIGSLGNFGCHSFNIDPRVFPAIRIFILVTAGFLCRKILFGG
ncbi:MAG: hypothetical protein QNK36_03920 [Colwellia sp.]|nr:hypothetical protein [Colwellia sp.]